MTVYQREREALGQRLRELRRDAQLTGRQLAESCRWQPSKVSKIESGKQTPSDHDLQAWAVACSASSVTADLLAALRSLDSHYVDHRRQHRAGLARGQRLIRELEAGSSFVRCFESTYVPGLLQTPDYARYMLMDDPTPGIATDVDDAVAARMLRQQVLYGTGRKFHFVITEAAMRYLLCPPEVMVGQLDRLVSAATMRSIHFGVIPSSARYGTATPGHGFVIHDEAQVNVETLTAQLTITEPSEISIYLNIFSDLAGLAVYGSQARAVIARVLAEMSTNEQ